MLSKLTLFKISSFVSVEERKSSDPVIKQRSVIHFDTIVTFISENLFIVYPDENEDKTGSKTRLYMNYNPRNNVVMLNIRCSVINHNPIVFGFALQQ